MKTNKDVALGWIKKAESDIVNLTTMLQKEKSLDTACFHAQQAAEKYLKAFLCFNNISFPKTHDIEELLELCIKIEEKFRDLTEDTVFLTDYGVEARYDLGFWPESEDVDKSLEAVKKIKNLVISILPDEMNPE